MRRRSCAVLALLIVQMLACAKPQLPRPSGSIEIVIAATTDIHGYVRGWDYYANAPDSTRGLTRVATIIDSLRKVSPTYPVVVDAGDAIQGNPLAFVAARVDSTMKHPVIAAMNAIEYDAAVVGNHEFNYGLGMLDRAVREARFPFIAANVFTANGTPRFRKWAVSTRRGVKIAIVGATTPGAMVWDRANLAAGGLSIRDIVPEVRSSVREARDAGSAVVIVVLHSGLNEASSYDTATTGLPSENVAARVAREVPGIDVIVYGHSHKEMADTVIGSTLLIQPKNWATSVAVAQLRVERRNNRWEVLSRRGRIIPAARRRESPLLLAVTQEGHRATMQYVNAPIGTTDVSWRADSARVFDSPLIDFVLEVQRRAAGTQLASTAVFSTNASIGPGPVTIARIASLYPYDNTLRAVKLTGAQLRAYLEQSARYYRTHADGRIDVDPTIPGFNYDVVSGVDYTIDLARPIGERITRLEFEGRPVAPADTFTMALNNYRQGGGGGFGMFSGAPVIYDRQQDIRQLLIDEVRRKGTLSPSDYFHRNWQIVPASAAATLLK